MLRIICILVLVALTGLPAAEAKLKVTATTGIVADLVRVIGGDRVELDTLMGAGVDPHLYRPTRSDVKRLEAARIIFYNGLLLEGRMSDIFIKVARRKPVYAVTELMPEEHLIELEEGYPDPHIWNDIDAWKQAAKVVADKLSEHDANGAAGYAERLAAYGQQLDSLQAFGKDALGKVPEGQRVLVTAHDAFNYFGRAYGFEVLGVQGISTEAEASLDDINKLVDLLVAKKVPAIFVESSVSQKNVEALIEGAAARGHKVTIGGELYSDAMGAEGTYPGTYVGMQDHNITTIARALGADVPPAGMQGKLVEAKH